MSNWILEDFTIEGISCQIVEFSVKHHIYVMVFNRVDAIRTQGIINDKAHELDINYRENSYDVKFDLKENFESDQFYEKPLIALSVPDMRKLGRIIKELLAFHYRSNDAEAYVCVAENHKLKRFYDRLAKLYTEELNFSVRTSLGEEGLGYEIKTPSYKGENG